MTSNYTCRHEMLSHLLSQEAACTWLQAAGAGEHQKVAPGRRRNVHVTVVENQLLETLTPLRLVLFVPRLQRQPVSSSPNCSSTANPGDAGIHPHP